MITRSISVRMTLPGIPALIMAVLLQPTASAVDTSGNAYKGWSVRSLAVQGIPPGVPDPTKGLAFAGQRGLMGRKHPPLFPDTTEQDILRLRLYLARHGYPYATVAPNYLPDYERNSVAIVLEVSPGPPVLVEDVKVTGLPPDMEAQGTAALTLAEGGLFVEKRVESSIQGLQMALWEAGYAHAVVRSESARKDSLRISVTFRVEPGSAYRLRQVRARGADGDVLLLAQEVFDLPRGALYAPRHLERGRDNLRLLNLFRQIRVSTEESGPESLDVLLDLAEGNHRTLRFGIGYWTDEFLRGSARWEHRNFFRRGRGISLEGRVSRFEQTASVLAWRPTLFGPRTRGTMRAGIERQNEASYSLRSAAIELGSSYLHSFTTTAGLALATTYEKFRVKTRDTEAFQDPGGLLTALSVSWTRDTSSDRVLPTAGTVLGVTGEWTLPSPLSESRFVLGNAAGTMYLKLVNECVLAGRLRVGVGAPLGKTADLLPSRRFFAGGATSMRGFKRRELGPAGPEGGPLGGEAKLEGSAELRYPLWKRLKGVVFVDCGQVWSRRREARLRDLEVAVGPGFMVTTPVGPVRMDVGFRLTDIVPRKPGAVLHISVGHPY